MGGGESEKFEKSMNEQRTKQKKHMININLYHNRYTIPSTLIVSISHSLQ